MENKKRLIGMEVGATACRILNFLKFHGDHFIGFKELEKRFGPEAGSALWELKELGLGHSAIGPTPRQSG